MNNQILNTNATLSAFMSDHPWLTIIALAWVLIWKGLALWKASKKGHLQIFIVFLILNTFGIGEIIYLLYMHFKNKKISQ